MASIKETKEMVKFAMSIANAVGSALEDGEASVSDLFEFTSALMAAKPALDGASDIPAELADMDDAEKTELKNYIATEFDIPQEGIERVAEICLRASVDLIDMVAEIIQHRKA